MKKHIDYLKKLDACPEAIPWIAQFNTLQQAWNVCEHGDWMLWLLGKQSGEPESKSRKKLVLTACKCARLSLKYVSKNEKRPLMAIETAEKWAKGDDSVSLLDVRNAAYAAYAGAANAANAAANAANAAANAANAAAASKVLKQCANIVRKDYPKIRMI